MTVTERVAALGLPLDQIVVIGSGLLDALSLRIAHDIDLAVSEHLFSTLKNSGDYTLSVNHGEEVLEKDDVEIWRSWGALPDEQFDSLYQTGVTLCGVTFCSPEIIMRHKKLRGAQKDLRDIELLKKYMDKHPERIA